MFIVYVYICICLYVHVGICLRFYIAEDQKRTVGGFKPPLDFTAGIFVTCRDAPNEIINSFSQLYIEESSPRKRNKMLHKRRLYQLYFQNWQITSMEAQGESGSTERASGSPPGWPGLAQLPRGSPQRQDQVPLTMYPATSQSTDLPRTPGSRKRTTQPVLSHKVTTANSALCCVYASSQRREDQGGHVLDGGPGARDRWGTTSLYFLNNGVSVELKAVTSSLFPDHIMYLTHTHPLGSHSWAENTLAKVRVHFHQPLQLNLRTLYSGVPLSMDLNQETCPSSSHPPPDFRRSFRESPHGSGTRDHKYVLVLVEYATRYPEGVSLQQATLKTTVRELVIFFTPAH